MSTVLEYSASAIATLEYKGKKEYAELKPRWIKEKQLLGYYNSMNRFFSESLDEFTIPKQFGKEKLLELLMDILKRSLNEDETFRNLIIKLSENYPRFPIDPEHASKYIVLLKTACHHVAKSGFKLNEEFASESYKSDIPYVIFSNLILSNYTISYFHEYKAHVTEQHFRRNFFLARGRPNLKEKKIALRNYFQMMKPTEEIFQKLLKAQFKLCLLLSLSNAKSIEDLMKEIYFLSVDKIDQKQLTKLISEHEGTLEQFRQHLFHLEPDLFKPLTEIDEPTQTMWQDMILLKITE